MTTNATPPAATPPAEPDAELLEWLRIAPHVLRTTSLPLAAIIPRLQQAADRLTALSERVAALTRERDEARETARIIRLAQKDAYDAARAATRGGNRDQ
jgi:hypothetical protein